MISLSKKNEDKITTLKEELFNLGLTEEDISPILDDLKVAFSFSNFFSKNCINHPHLLKKIIEENDFFKSFPKNEYKKRIFLQNSLVNNFSDISSILLLFKKKELLRIVFRDLCQYASLFETIFDLTNLAESCLNFAFFHLYEILRKDFGSPTYKNGKPQNIVVLAFGKLGSRELNFSSDLDLILSFPESGQTKGGGKGQITNESFFLKLSQKLIEIFNFTDKNKHIYRIDLRLRPYGDAGPLVMSFSAMENYYQSQGREWERYALIKARPIAGDLKEGQKLISILKPFVYRKYVDFGVFEALREMKESINLSIKEEKKENIKIGKGGIREIEFFGQVFQLVRGGYKLSLQKRKILSILKTLKKRKYIDNITHTELREAYIFLRITENRLQEYDDEQTHILPNANNLEARHRLALSVGFDDFDSFYEKLKKHQKDVHNHFNKILEQEKSEKNKDLKNLWKNLLSHEEKIELLEKLNFNEKDEIIKILEDTKNFFDNRSISLEGRERIDKIIPVLLKEISENENPSLILNRLIEFIKAIEKRTSYIVLLLENQASLKNFIKLFAKSAFVSSFITKYPILIDELIDRRKTDKIPSKEELESDLKIAFRKFKVKNLEDEIGELALFKNNNILKICFLDIIYNHPLTQLSLYLTNIAEIIIKKTCQIAWKDLTYKYNLQKYENDFAKNFAIISYGKLGGKELSYKSDLDLVFLFSDESSDKELNSYFFTKLGQKIISYLGLNTSLGSLYEIDVRLRPSGSSGVLVSKTKSFYDYQIKEAWTWEHQALIKARFVYGDSKIQEEFSKIRNKIISQKRNKDELLSKIINMKKNIEKEHGSKNLDKFHLKFDQGGVISIEFLVQFLILLNAHEYKDLTKPSSTRGQLKILFENNLIFQKDFEDLEEIYIKYRAKIHSLNLEDKNMLVDKKDFEDSINRINMIWDKFLK